ncbi:family 20 glycosylhydrolase [Sphingobacterium composti Ten et al. 2007 non Yoo et al. 2007]|uniref:family 20 glycosylhydrolase n=1 Tax=Sphingobacterium composti TaxID=363260 RepID=UPI00135A0122|nr:family 20 glycosylhydrolase [Sphingobacterium composti Ten et al. 2007 non Yoo et al. 2007]
MISLFSGVSYSQNKSVDLALHWKPSSSYDGKENLELILTLKNKSNVNIHLDEWNLFFNSMYPAVELSNDSYKLVDLRGNHFKIEFFNQNLMPNDSIEITYTTKYAISGISTVPNGFYLLNKSDQKTFVGIEDVTYEPLKITHADNKTFLEKLYAKNESFKKSAPQIHIFPSPKYLKELSGQFSINRILKVSGDDKEVSLFEHELNRILVFERANSSNADIRLIHKESLSKEAYNMLISKESITLEYSTMSGLFYALQSIKSLHKGLIDKSHFPCMEVKDEPRYTYRGFMLDIARNFRDKSVILKYLDLMAENKLNVFHFHFIEDEAWRIEILGLPELTEVGSWRSPLHHFGNALKPAYGSGVNEAKQYLTREDFIEILKYAKERHIRVVPEIETPGHARASIKAMEYRYHKYMQAGNKQAAEEYLLHDLDDASEYNTAQNFGDNVLNPALPSVYKFLDKVLTEFKSMYVEAGVPFEKVSLGGDEVPPGVWEKSPRIQELMKREGLANVYQIWTYYISKINELCTSKGLQMAGWEEIGMVNNGTGMVVNHDMPNKQNMQLDVWNNIIGGGQDDLVYRLANAGYPTVLISASNTYFDMMWDTSFEEPGLKWATYADLYHSYSLFPEDYFANIHTYYSGAKLNKSYINKLVRINEKGRSNFLGIKGGVFAETLLKDENLDYLAFPRFYVLAERAWSPRRVYENENSYDKKKFDVEYISFLNRIAKVELPSIANRVKFRLPRVGLKLDKNVLSANLEYPGFSVYYTTDGTTPSLKSNLFNTKNGIIVNEGQVISIAVVDEWGRTGVVSTLNIY